MDRAPLLAFFVVWAGLAHAQPAAVQTYPDKPIRIIVPSAPGGPTDLPARLAAQILPPKLGQPVVVENRAGGAGAIGARAVASSRPRRLYAARRQHQRVRRAACSLRQCGL